MKDSEDVVRRQMDINLNHVCASIECGAHRRDRVLDKAMFNGLNGVCSASIIQHDITRKNLVDAAMREKPRFCTTFVAY